MITLQRIRKFEDRMEKIRVHDKLEAVLSEINSDLDTCKVMGWNVEDLVKKKMMIMKKLLNLRQENKEIFEKYLDETTKSERYSLHYANKSGDYIAKNEVDFDNLSVEFEEVSKE